MKHGSAMIVGLAGLAIFGIGAGPMISRGAVQPASPTTPDGPVQTARPETPTAARVEIGDPAPGLGPVTWIKGSVPGSYAKGRVYVVEFWGMRAPACRRSALLLSELQGLWRNKGVTIIGVSVMDPSGQGEVEQYVRGAGEHMAYPVAYDARGEAAKRFMQPTGQRSIPVSFVVDREGRLAWVGQTLDGLDRVLEKVVAGSWDLGRAKTDARRRAEAEKKSEPLASRLAQEFASNHAEKALRTMDELVLVDSAVTGDWAVTKFGYLLLEKKDSAGAYAYAAAAADGPIKDNAAALQAIAWMTLAEPGVEKRDTALALRLARRANELTTEPNPSVLDTLAKAMFETGDLSGAVATQKRAVEACTLPSQQKELEQRLAQYESAASPAK